MATDQTASLLPVRNLDPLPLMLDMLAAFAKIPVQPIGDEQSPNR
jgi:hypothetical protein